MVKIEIKNRYSDKVIFEYSKGGNTLKETVEIAVKSKVSLRGADLRGADLREANLIEANLIETNLSEADLRGADLREANLGRAILRGADLSDTDLRGANLVSCVGNMQEIMTLQVDTYPISFTKQDLQIGCKNFTHDEWRNFTDREISNFDNGSLVWWKKWKDWLFLTIELRFGEERMIKPNTLWRYTKTGNVYHVLSIGETEQSRTWVKSVTYRSGSGNIHTHDYDDFKLKFKEVENEN